MHFDMFLLHDFHFYYVKAQGRWWILDQFLKYFNTVAQIYKFRHLVQGLNLDWTKIDMIHQVHKLRSSSGHTQGQGTLISCLL